MSDVNERILQASQGQMQLHPDQQREYLGTFRERVVLTVTLPDCRQEDSQSRIILALERINQCDQNLTLKINGRLGSSTQVTFLQLAQKLGMKATVIDDITTQSPYGLVVHTEQAEDCTTTDIRERYPDLWQSNEKPEKGRKISFWQRLFGNKEV